MLLHTAQQLRDAGTEAFRLARKNPHGQYRLGYLFHRVNIHDYYALRQLFSTLFQKLPLYAVDERRSTCYPMDRITRWVVVKRCNFVSCSKSHAA